jgi:hypothetical protein
MHTADPTSTSARGYSAGAHRCRAIRARPDRQPGGLFCLSRPRPRPNAGRRVPRCWSAPPR